MENRGGKRRKKESEKRGEKSERAIRREKERGREIAAQ